MADQPQPIHIFRAGTHVAADGRSVSFSDADLAAAASAYDPAVHEAPLVIGHPKDTAPAYGWVAGMIAQGGELHAIPAKVNAEFAELVRSGAYAKVSASFYLPDAVTNPKPGAYYLRHVGFLGAQPPAIKGLAPVQFGEAGGDTVTVEFAELSDSLGWRLPWMLRGVARLFRRLRDATIETQGVEAADKMISDYDITDIERAAADIETASAVEANRESPASSFSETVTNEVPVPPIPAAATPTPADLEVQAAKLKADQASFAEQQTAFRRAQHSSLLDGLVAEGRPLPCDKTVLLDFMDAISESGTISFAEGPARPALEVFRSEILAKLPRQVDFAERAPGGNGGDGEADPTTLAREAVAYQETMRGQGVMITTTEAVAHVTKERSK